MPLTTQPDARVWIVLMAARKVGNHVYLWGGESANEGGFDCSGFVSVVLAEAARSYPDLYDGQRRTAAGLYSYYDSRHLPNVQRVEDLLPGMLVFYRRPGQRIHHVALHVVTVPPVEIDGVSRAVGPLSFEAGGSGSAATSPRAALLQSAGVRLSASDSHGGAEWVAKDPVALLERLEVAP